MIVINEKQNCCGCTACYNICPKKAIAMLPDAEGFLYPKTDQDKCINCGLCEKVCPIHHRTKHEENTKAYIFRYGKPEIVEQSTSGGAFTAISEFFLKKGAVVYGAGYDSNMTVVCKATTETDGLQEMRGSKFVQSNLGSVFTEIRNRLKKRELVVFSGTPCQVSGLVSYLGGKSENLFCIDIVCRGVPSPGLWRNYVNMMEKKYGANMTGARFKHKTYGYHATTMKVDFANGKTYYGSGRVDPMMKAFVKELASRPSCSACAFKGVERLSDITIFDCYEYSRITGEKDDNKGWSSVLVHTELGRSILEKLGENSTVIPVGLDEIVTENGIMVNHSAKPNEKRDEFYRLIKDMTIGEAISLVCPIGKKDFLIESAKSVLYKMGMVTAVKKIRKHTSVPIEKNSNI